MLTFARHSLVFILCFLTLGHSDNISSSCRIPISQEGRCISSDDCLVYKQALDQKPLKHVEFLRQLQCGNSTEIEQVCCPFSGNYSFVSLPKPSQKRQRPILTQRESILGNRFADEDILPSGNDCGQQSTEKIYGGEITAIDEFPWMALLKYKRKLKDGLPILACGGVLINQRYVLTAAHCITGPDIETLQGLDSIRLGEYNILEENDCVIDGGYEDCADPIVEVGYEKIIAHPKYNHSDKNQYNDIALIKLERNIAFTDFIQPICLPIPANVKVEPGPKTKFFVSGWGRTEYRNQPSPVKLKLQIPMVKRELCEGPYTNFGISVRETQICAGGDPGKDTCKGDSGGPLMCIDAKTGNWITSGVVSIGPNHCGKSKIPGIYTNVKDYIDWIVQSMQS